MLKTVIFCYVCDISYLNCMKNKVIQYTFSGEFMKEWDSQYAIEKELRYSSSAIGRVCKGVRKHAYNFQWKYKSDAIINKTGKYRKIRKLSTKN